MRMTRYVTYCVVVTHFVTRVIDLLVLSARNKAERPQGTSRHSYSCYFLLTTHPSPPNKKKRFLFKSFLYPHPKLIGRYIRFQKRLCLTHQYYILLCPQALNHALFFANSKQEELLLVHQNLRHSAEQDVSLASL